MRIALISEHASPLARLGGVDAGGQNVYVAQVARSWRRAGIRSMSSRAATIRRLPAIVELAPGVRVVHVDAGPASVRPQGGAARPHAGVSPRS